MCEAPCSVSSVGVAPSTRDVLNNGVMAQDPPPLPFSTTTSDADFNFSPTSREVKASFKTKEGVPDRPNQKLVFAGNAW
ncbi:hypothetical protein Tco_0503890 [Tanacetum coccineum]